MSSLEWLMRFNMIDEGGTEVESIEGGVKGSQCNRERVVKMNQDQDILLFYVHI